jgi:L,D-peptidoglycan transpeptidase YkuD (ErfK/YbiS/YcfS/YnhG family)
MSLGRVLSSLAAALAVAGCATVAVGMSRASGESNAADTASVSVPTPTPRPAFLPPSPPAAAPTNRPAPTASTSRASSSRASSSPASSPGSVARSGPGVAVRPPAVVVASTAPAHPVTAPAPRPNVPARSVAKPTVKVAPKAPARPRGQSLPVRYSTGSATRVITVTGRSTHSTTATLQAWTKAAGGGWIKYGSSVTAHVGADGLSTHPSETRSATPIGSFTLTQAFGYYSDPGTALPYFKTRSSDWWISQPGKLYNTHQRCSSHCAFTRGGANEHLHYETPFYNYAVVIDYNTRNAPGGVRAGAGSAFFLHVTDGHPTAGCVSIPQSKLVTIMRWLTPAAHPRILIGVS